MRHASCARRLSQFADDTLPSDIRTRMEAHLESCTDCRDELSGLRSTIDLLGALATSVELPREFRGQVMARIDAGEADPSVLGRLGGVWCRWMDSSVGPPLLTAALGMSLLLLVQGVEIEVTLPGFLAANSAQDAQPLGGEGSSLVQVPGSGIQLAESATRSAAAPAAGPPAAHRRRVVIPAMPPFAACLRGTEAGCGRWYAWHVGLGMREPIVFLREVENVPDRARERWLAELSRFAAHSGKASVLAARLRESGDPRAQGIAAHFEQIATAPSR